MTIDVWYGTRQNKHLSNLEYRPFYWEGRLYKTVEQAYQSNKSGNFDRDTYNRYTENGAGQKHIGHRALTENRWYIRLMHELIKASFDQNLKYKLALIATGNDKITHIHDKGIWKDEFPRILMELRDEFKN
jgi:predicted NAD-dependent protein-ADP-ribosyltransferase YbiA (DUF1768 family)